MEEVLHTVGRRKKLGLLLLRNGNGDSTSFWILLWISPETKTQDKFHFYISENLLEYTLKQEYNKIEYTSNVEYTNYYSSNLNTGTFPLKLQLKKKERKRKRGEKGGWGGNSRYQRYLTKIHAEPEWASKWQTVKLNPSHTCTGARAEWHGVTAKGQNWLLICPQLWNRQT